MPKQRSEASTFPHYEKLNIVSMGGKGGTGKTTFLVSLVDWFRANDIPVRLNDLDFENQTKGGLKHYYKEAQKINAHVRDSLDVFFEAFDGEESVVISDMGAGQGEAAQRWFSKASEQALEMKIGFLFVGVITTDPASVTSVLQWGEALQAKVRYLIVLNEMSEEGATFQYWHKSEPAKQFCQAFGPQVITFPSIPSFLQGPMSDHGLNLRQIIDKSTGIPALGATRHRANAMILQKRISQAFDKAIPPFLPEV